MPLTLQSLVPFGKYKGKPYLDLLRDASYCHFLIRSNWLNGATKEFIESYYTTASCRKGKMYAQEDIWIDCPSCNGNWCLSNCPEPP